MPGQSNGDAPCDDFHREFDPETESPSNCVVVATAAVRGVEPVALEQLARTIDPDALDALFERDGREDRAELRVTFEYEGFDVTVVNGDIWLRCADPRRAAAGDG